MGMGRLRLALLLGAAGWLAWAIVWWAGHGTSPHQTLILWQHYGLWEWIVEGALFPLAFVFMLWTAWRQ